MGEIWTVNKVDNIGIVAFKVSGDSCAENGINYAVTWLSPGFYLFIENRYGLYASSVVNHMKGKTKLPDNVEIGFRITSEFIGVDEKKENRGAASLV